MVKSVCNGGGGSGSGGEGGNSKLCQIIELKLIWELYNLQPDGKRAI